MKDSDDPILTGVYKIEQSIQAQLSIFNHMRSIRLLLMAILFLPVFGSSQSVSGFWYGSGFIKGEDGDRNSYMVELVLTENGRTVQGVLNYYFLNLYRSVPVTAIFDRAQQVLTFKDVPFIYYGSTLQKDVDCYMNGRFNLVLARAGSTLTGQWFPGESYKNTCPPILARLKLDKDQTMSDSVAQVIKNIKDTYKIWTAPPSGPGERTTEQQVSIVPPSPNPKEENNPSQTTKPKITSAKPTTPTAIKSDTKDASTKRVTTEKKPSRKNKLFSKKKQPEKVIADDGRSLSQKKKPGLFKEKRSEKSQVNIDPKFRKTTVVEELELEIDSVRISLYDNGEIDGDTISVLLNNARVVTNQPLSARPILLLVPLDSLSEYVELVMVAENLGSIPPNTAIMMVEAGDKTYRIQLSSTLEENASIRIKRKRKGLRIR